MTEIKQLEGAIAALEAQRATLGDDVVDTALAPMREKLAALKAQGASEQRKLVTVLFADIAGFTAISEAMDAEVVNETLSALWERLDAVILAHGGTIDKHIGDEVMALWGMEKAREDDPERAVRAGLDIQDELANCRKERDIQWEIRVGIHTGPVLLGEVRPGEFTATGDTVNLAARIQTLAPVGGILITHDTYSHVRGMFDMQTQSPVTVRGRSEPTRTYIVERARPRAFRVETRGIEGIRTDMIGRADKLQSLQDAYHHTLKNAQTCLVTVTGEAGIGKSRLLYEFENYLKELPKQPLRLRSRATPGMHALPYGLIRDLFAYHFDIRESDSAAAALEKFRIGTGAVLAPEKADIVGHFIGFDFSSSPAVQNLIGSPSYRDLAMAYLNNYMRALAEGPVVMFLDDIHWADHSSLDFLEHLVKTFPQARLFIVCLTRLRLYEQRPAWGEAGGAFTRLDIEPLTLNDSEKLVRSILEKVDELPDHLCDLIVENAEGVPFYIEELIKMLMEEGVIVRGEERWQIAIQNPEDIRIPPTLTEIIQSRLDSLPYEEKMLLQRASVVGRQFWDMLVSELETEEYGKLKRDDIATLLDAARSRELIFQLERSAFEGTREYIFKHATLRDVTYETVLLKLRRVYHAQVARWLEKNAQERLDEYLSLIANHYEMAAEYARAAEYFERAADESIKINAYQDAISSFEHARRLLPNADQVNRARVSVKLGNAYNAISNYPLATQYTQEGLELAEESNQPDIQVQAYVELGRITSIQGRYEEAENHLEKALGMTERHGDIKGKALSLSSIISVAFRTGDFEKARIASQKTLEIFREQGDRQGIAATLRRMSSIVRSMDSYEEAGRYLEESLALYRKIGDRQGAAACLNNLGEVARVQGKYEEAARCYEQSLEIAQEIDLRLVIAAGLINLGLVYCSLKQDATASKYLHEALEKSAAIGVIPIMLFALTGLVELEIRAQNPVQAAELLGLVLTHPGVDAQNKQEAEPLLEMLRESLPTDELETALERGKVKDLDATTRDLLEQYNLSRK